MGLVAVCLALMTIQKVNRQNEELVEVKLKGVKDGLAESNRAIRSLVRRLAALEKDIETLNNAGESVPVLKGQMEKLRSELSALDSSIPEQFRARLRV